MGSPAYKNTSGVEDHPIITLLWKSAPATVQWSQMLKRQLKPGFQLHANQGFKSKKGHRDRAQSENLRTTNKGDGFQWLSDGDYESMQWLLSVEMVLVQLGNRLIFQKNII